MFRTRMVNHGYVLLAYPTHPLGGFITCHSRRLTRPFRTILDINLRDRLISAYIDISVASVEKANLDTHDHLLRLAENPEILCYETLSFVSVRALCLRG